MSVVNGTDLYVWLNGELVAYSTSYTISMSMETRPRTNKGSGVFRSVLPGMFSFSASCEGLYVFNSSAGSIANAFINRMPVSLQFGSKDSVTGLVDESLEYFSGDYYITDFELNATDAENATWSASFAFYDNFQEAGETLLSVTTTVITSITTTTASTGGFVISEGESAVTARGVCYNTTGNPTTADDTTSDGTGGGAFTSSLTDLEPDTTYYVRAYATNSEGTSYGSSRSFATQVVEEPYWDEAVLGRYYVKTGGNDALDGLTDATAWGTITKVNSEWAASNFAAGNIIRFKRGDTFTGTITAAESGTSGSPITIGSYYTGDLPIIEGFTTLSSWTSVGGNIYYATLSGSVRTEMVTINGVQFAMGRWPNAGTWNTVATRPSTTEITDTTLTGSPDWDGAELVIRQNRWILTRHTITDHTDDSITFSTALRYNPVGYGYFIQNHVDTLTTHGEWFHDTAANRLYIYTTNAPATYTIRASNTAYGVNVGTREHITIENLNLRGFNSAAVYANYGAYTAHGLTVDGCTISYSGGDAIYVNRASGETISDNTISYSNHCAVTLWGAYGTASSVTGNNISYSGTIPGGAFDYYGATLANNAYDAVYVNPENITVSGNNITYTGYIPVNYRGTNALIEENYISHYAYVKDDAAGIYVYANTSPNKQVLNNIILHGLGATEGMPANSFTSAHGIYTDGASSDVHFEGNIIGYMSAAGYHGNIPVDVTITNNLFFDCAQFIDLWKYTDAAGYINGLTITYNHFVSSTVNEELPSVIKYQNTSAAYYTDLATEIAYFGTIDYNSYFINTECAVYIGVFDLEFCAPQSMARWIADFGHDAHSTVTVMDSYTLNSIGSNLLTNGDFASNINGWSGTSGCTPAWDNTDELGAGGSLQLTSTQDNYDWYWWSNDNAVVTAIDGGVVDNDEHYILRFLGKSAIDEKTVSLRLRNTGTGYTSQRFFTIGDTNTQKDVLYSNPPDVASGATMRLVMCDDPVVTYLDNVGLYVADVTLTTWSDYIHLLYNNTSAAVTYTMSATMEDPEGTEYDTVTLQPFEGIILIGNGTIT